MHRLLAIAAFAIVAACAPQAVPVDCRCAADASTPADAAPDTTAPLPVAATPACTQPWVTLAAESSRLLAPPMQSVVHATSDGLDVDDLCAWSVGPSSVCVTGSAPNRIRRVGPGNCTAVCQLGNGLCGSVTLHGQKQTLLYVVGGEVNAFPPKPGSATDAARIQRLRTLDGAWDHTVAFLPEYRIGPALGTDASGIWVLGGQTGGDYKQVTYWDIFFPTCDEAIITPTQLKAEIGCRAVRRLDLLTGQWTSPLQWPHPRVDAQTLQVGHQLYLVGGQRAKTVTEPAVPELWAIADLDKHQLTTPAAPPPDTLVEALGPLQWAGSPAVQWQGQLLAFAGKATWQLDEATGQWQAHPLGWMCPEIAPRQVVRVPNTDKLWVVASETAAVTGACGPCVAPSGGGKATCTPQQYDGKAWTAGPALPFGRLVPADDGLYLLGEAGSYKLAADGQAWQQIGPPMPYLRYGFAAVAVTQ